MNVQNVAAIAADIDLLTIHLIGENLISAKNNQAGADYAAISNGQQIAITGEEDASLKVTVEQNAGEETAAVAAGCGMTNSATIQLEVIVEADVYYAGNLYGLKCGVDGNQPGFLENNGAITTKVYNKSLSAWSGTNAYAIFISGGAMHNSSTLDMTVSSTNGNVYGLRGSSTTELWNNEGAIFSNVTAYGGNYEGFEEETGGDANYACAVSVVTSSSNGLKMQNSGTMDLDAVNHAQNAKHYEYAIGLELDSNATSFTNSGKINIDALEAYTWGIYLSNLTDDAVLRNSGDITIKATSSGRVVEYPTYFSTATGIGINMTNFDSDPTPVKTEMILESGSRLNISVGAAESAKGIFNEAVAGMTYDQWRELMQLMANIPEDEEITYEEWVNYQCCQGIQLQKLFFADPQYGEVPQDISMTDDLTILEGEGEYDGGELIAVFEDFYVPQGMWLYINTIGNYFTDPADGSTYSMPSKNIVILPKLTGTVAIQGMPQVGSTLTVQMDELPGDAEVTYQWQISDTPQGTFTDIEGATEESYTLTSQENGKYIRVVVTAVGDNYGGSLYASTESAVTTPFFGDTKPTYPPVVTDCDGGKTSVTPAHPKQGDIVTIITEPEAGKKVEKVTVTDLNGNPVDVKNNGDGTYIFTQPSGNVTIEVTYRAKECSGTEADNCPSLAFDDLDTGKWYHESVDYAIEKDLMNGTGDRTFSPDTFVTRAQAVAALWRLEGKPVANYLLTFKDVAEGQWYTEAIRWAASVGVVKGYSADEYGTDDYISRQDMAAIFYRYAAYKGYDVSASDDLDYSDAGEIKDYALTAMRWVCGAGIFEGNGDGTVNPLGNTKRCELAALMMRFIENTAH